MSRPWRVAIDASNQPTATQNYEHGATPLTAMRAPSAGLVDGRRYLLLAEEVDGSGAPAGAWEITEAVWHDAATDYFERDVLVASSSGALIDWSVVEATPRLRVLDQPGAPALVASASTEGADVAALAIEYDFVPGHVYKLVATDLRGVLAVSQTNEQTRMRVRRVGQGGYDATNEYSYKAIGRSGNSYVTNTGEGVAEIETDTLSKYTQGNPSSSEEDRTWLDITCFNAGDAKKTTFIIESGARVSTGSSASVRYTAMHHVAEALDGIQIYGVNGGLSYGELRLIDLGEAA